MIALHSSTQMDSVYRVRDHRMHALQLVQLHAI